MSGLAWFKFYPKDFLADSHVLRMTPSALGVYVRLLCVHWEEGRVPTDERELARIGGLALAPFRKLWPQIAPCFEASEDGHAWVQKRMHAELEKVRMKAAKNKAAGTKGAQVRWHGATEMPSKTDTESEKPRSQEVEDVHPTSPPAIRRAARKKPSGPHAELVQFWMDLWDGTRGEPYAFEGGKDGAAVKKCLGYAKGDVGLVQTRMRRLIEDPPDPWIAQNASLSILMSKWNALGVHVHTLSDGEKLQAEIDAIRNGGGNDEHSRDHRNNQGRQTTLERHGGPVRALGEGVRPSPNGRAG